MYGDLGGVVGVEVSMHYKYTALVKASYIHVWWLHTLGGVGGVEVSMHYKYTALVKASYIHVW